MMAETWKPVKPREIISAEIASRRAAKLFTCNPGTRPLQTPRRNPIAVHKSNVRSATTSPDEILIQMH
jgi:hypothetical protein